MFVAPKSPDSAADGDWKQGRSKLDHDNHDDFQNNPRITNNLLIIN
jgi:hypothetical protein